MWKKENLRLLRSCLRFLAVILQRWFIRHKSSESVLITCLYRDVRRAALLNIPLSPITMDAVLARTRDSDTIMRKLVYSAILNQHCFDSDGAGMGVVHPRVLTIAQREFIIRNGLGDREPAVRQAAGSLLGTWVDVARGDVKNDKSKSLKDDVLALLSLFDLMESTVAEDALLSVFDRRHDISDHLEFEGGFDRTTSVGRANWYLPRRMLG